MATATATKSKQESAQDRAAKKSANFKRLAAKRVNRALASIGGLTQLSNRNSYTYDSAQVQKIVAALEGKVKEVRTAFETAGSGAGAGGFTL